MTTADSIELIGIILAFIATNIGHLVAARANSNKMMDALKEQSEKADAAFDKAMSVYAAKTDAKIDELTRHVEQHNSVITRVYELEKSRDVLDERVKVANHRIDDLEKARV